MYWHVEDVNRTDVLYRTKDGQPIDVVGVILGTANREHTKRLEEGKYFVIFLIIVLFFSL